MIALKIEFLRVYVLIYPGSALLINSDVCFKISEGDIKVESKLLRQPGLELVPCTHNQSLTPCKITLLFSIFVTKPREFTFL